MMKMIKNLIHSFCIKKETNLINKKFKKKSIISNVIKTYKSPKYIKKRNEIIFYGNINFFLIDACIKFIKKGSYNCQKIKD